MEIISAKQPIAELGAYASRIALNKCNVCNKGC